MTKQWLDMGLRPRAVTRDLDWGIPLPLEGDEWDGKVYLRMVRNGQGYCSCANCGRRDRESEDYEKW